MNEQQESYYTTDIYDDSIINLLYKIVHNGFARYLFYLVLLEKHFRITKLSVM